MFDHVKFGVSDYAASKAFFPIKSKIFNRSKPKSLVPMGRTVFLSSMDSLMHS
jgi:hypothetical protein